jgi:hypothetical protein
MGRFIDNTLKTKPAYRKTPSMPVLALVDSNQTALSALLQRFGLALCVLETDQPIPGSHWGESEAGLLANALYARPDTPLHSVLHEACHYICMTPDRRSGLHTNAGGDDVEENAVCYLQILLADHVPGFGRARMQLDMDAWGYSFRLGSAQKWFEEDASDAWAWLLQHDIIDATSQVTWRLREEIRVFSRHAAKTPRKTLIR